MTKKWGEKHRQLCAMDKTTEEIPLKLGDQYYAIITRVGSKKISIDWYEDNGSKYHEHLKCRRKLRAKCAPGKYCLCEGHHIIHVYDDSSQITPITDLYYFTAPDAEAEAVTEDDNWSVKPVHGD